MRIETTNTTARASAAEARIPTLDQPAAEAWLAVQLAAACKVRRLAAAAELPRLAGASAGAAAGSAGRPTLPMQKRFAKR
jgi:hypothetical protein